MDVRVILLGRTGLDASLRLDPSLELVRVRTPLEAIGELAHPMDPLGPARAVVVVAPTVDGLLGEGAADEARVDEFVSALRVAHPGVVVLGVQNGHPAPASFDAGLRADATGDSLRAAVRWRPGVTSTPGAIIERCADAAPQRPVPTPPASPRRTGELGEDALIAALLASPQAAEVSPARTAPTTRNTESNAPAEGDLAIVALLLRGQDIAPACVEAIRQRCGDAGIVFSGIAERHAPAGGVSVVWEGVTYGELRAARTPAPVLAPHARWLAGWLRLRDQQDQLRSAAFTDHLTGAWNRRYFDRFLVSAIEQARATRRQVTVLLFDIDDFKKYNDSYGHEAGDDILREVVRLLRSTIRPTDRVCRVGGDEFAVIFNEPEGPRQEGSRPPDSVFGIAQRFQQQILRHRFPKLLDCAPGTLTISGGLATFPWDGATPDELLAKADQLAMASKKQGKNAITMGPGAMRVTP